MDGNGGEYRMSLHGTAKGSAMLMQSPRQFQIQPMIINTKARPALLYPSHPGVQAGRRRRTHDALDEQCVLN